MNQLDVYYRALLEYRAATAQNRECNNFAKLISAAGTEADKMTVTRTVCTIEEDWIEEIEKGLDFIEKAIKEERQFIYSNGEVVPIEKVKHVSTESVRHLAKHSNLIGKADNEEDFVPDRLYTVERLNDYAVYENRFLYMLLCYLRDFVSLRYSKILDLTNKYDGVLELDKEVVIQKQKITYRLSLHDERMDDKYLRANNSAKETIDRIDLILKAIISFLSTPLMEFASKTPMLKPPITKTNVLKMDNNFKGAVALYDYIIAYSKDGYTVEEQKIDLAPFREDVAEELSEACAMLTFLTYEHGLGLTTTLKNRYEQEEQRRKEEAIKRRAEKLSSIRKKIGASGESPEEYIAELEKQIKALESANAELEPLRKELYRLQEKNEELTRKAALAESKAEKIVGESEAVEERHARELGDTKNALESRIRENLLKYEEETATLRKACDERVFSATSEVHRLKEQARKDEDVWLQKLSESEKARDKISEEYDKLAEEKRLCEARIKALRTQQNLMTEEDDFTEKESFGELEAEFEAFKRFYKSEWSRAKKKIRKKILNRENIKGQKGGKKPKNLL